MRAGVLIRNEALKTTRRFAYWVTLLAFSGISTTMVLEPWLRGRANPENAFTLPGAWADVLGDAGPLPAFFGAVALILLIASEFTWRTARQNVIDGLSKGEFFLGKALAWPPVVLSFMLALLALVAVFGLAGSAGAGTAGPFIQAADLAHIGGLSVTALGYTSIAFFLAFLARSSGAAMGLFFLWIAFFEQILGKLLGLVGGVAASAAGFLPRAVFDRLIEREQYDAAARQAAVDAAVEAGRTAPEFLPTGLLVGASFAWVAVFVLLAFQVYRRRDL